MWPVSLAECFCLLFWLLIPFTITDFPSDRKPVIVSSHDIDSLPDSTKSAKENFTSAEVVLPGNILVDGWSNVQNRSPDRNMKSTRRWIDNVTHHLIATEFGGFLVSQKDTWTVRIKVEFF